MDWTYDGIKTALKDRLSLLSNWANTLYYGVYERILDVIAYITNRLIYIIQFYYRESSWTQAQKIESLARECVLLSYNYHRKIGAIGSIILSSDPLFSPSYLNVLNDTPIPRWTLFQDVTGTVNVYCTETYLYLKNAAGNQIIPVKEGIPRSYLYTAQGVSDEVIHLYPTDLVYGIDNDELDVYIAEADGTILYEVNQVDNLYFIDDLINYYCTVKNVPDFSSVEITFGDGIRSPKLNVGQYVLIKYADTLGDQGNVQSTGVITVISSTIEDVYGTDVTSLLYVNNIESISDGVDFEDIESIRNNAPNLFQAGYRAGTLIDWETIINNIPFVYRCALWTVEDLGGSSLISEQNTVYIAGISTSGDELTLTQQTDIELDYLRERKSPTEIIAWQDLEKIYAFFIVDAKINNLTSDIVTLKIKNALREVYATINVDFQTNVYESAYNGVINTVPEIVYHYTDLYHMQKDVAKTAVSETIYPSYTGIETPTLSDQVWLTNNSMKLWIKQKISNAWSDVKQIGATSGTVIYSTMPSSFTITGGAINYSYNSYSYVITSTSGTFNIMSKTQNPGALNPDGYILYLSYQTKDGYGLMTNCIRMPRKYQITDIDDEFILTTINFV